MPEIMNQDLYARFFETVKAGKVDGFAVVDSPTPFGWIQTPSKCVVRETAYDYSLDVLCADLRRWLTSEGVDWAVREDTLILDTKHKHKAFFSCDYRTEIDRHLAAALWWLEAKEKNGN